MSPVENPPKDSNSKDLSNTEAAAYTPAYKNNPETKNEQRLILSADLKKVIQAWPQLPENIKKAIQALVKAIPQ